VYSITAAGRAEFAAWLETPQAPPAHREAFLIQLFFAAQLSNAQIVAMLEHQLSIRRHRLDDLRALAASIPPRSPDEVPDRRHLLSWMTLDFGLRLEYTYVLWLTDTIAAVKALPDTAPAVASADV
jgi:hypothetical protein